jgi:hypothetical protein
MKQEDLALLKALRSYPQFKQDVTLVEVPNLLLHTDAEILLVAESYQDVAREMNNVARRLYECGVQRLNKAPFLFLFERSNLIGLTYEALGFHHGIRPTHICCL